MCGALCDLCVTLVCFMSLPPTHQYPVGFCFRPKAVKKAMDTRPQPCLMGLLALGAYGQKHWHTDFWKRIPFHPAVLCVNSSAHGLTRCCLINWDQPQARRNMNSKTWCAFPPLQAQVTGSRSPNIRPTASGSM